MKELDKFIQHVSHDLHAPLRQIDGFLQLLKNEHSQHLDAEAQEYIAFAVAGAKKMQGMLDDLATLAAVDSDTAAFVSVDMNAVLDEVRNALGTELSSRNIVLQSEALPTIAGQPRQLYSLLHELVANAVQHNSQQSELQVKVFARLEPSDVHIFVADNGSGIPEAQTDRVFDMFQRLGPESAARQGSGLTIARRIATSYGGSLNYIVKTDAEDGTMHLRLPRS